MQGIPSVWPREHFREQVSKFGLNVQLILPNSHSPPSAIISLQDTVPPCFSKFASDKKAKKKINPTFDVFTFGKSQELLAILSS